MLRRQFILATLFGSLTTVLTGRTIQREIPTDNFLGRVPFNDLRRLRIYTELADGTTVEHVLNWYGRMHVGHQWSIFVSSSLTLDKPKPSVGTFFSIDGNIIGKTSGSRGDKLNAGTQDQVIMHRDESKVAQQNIFFIERHPRHMVSVQSYLAHATTPTN